MEDRNRLWIMLGAGAVAVVIAVAVIVVVALNLTGGGGTAGSATLEGLPGYAHALGEADAPVTVIEFGDFQ